MGSVGVAKLNLILKKGGKPAWGTSAGRGSFAPSPVPAYLHPAVTTVDVAKANLQLTASLVHQVFYLLNEEVVVLHARKADSMREGDEGRMEDGYSLQAAAFPSPQPVLVTSRETVGLMLIWLGRHHPLAFTCRRRRSLVPKCWGS